MNDKCLFPECTRQSQTRGLCTNHYTSAARYVKLGRTSWKTLEALGKCLDARNMKTVNSWFLDGKEPE